MLQSHGLWRDTKAKPAEQSFELSNSDGTSLRSTIQYLIRVHGSTTVQPMFASVVPDEKWSKLNHWNAASAIVDGLNVTIAKEREGYRTFARETNVAIDVQGFRRLWSVGVWGQHDGPWKPDAYDEVRIGLQNGILQLALNETEPPSPVPMDQFFAGLPLTTSDKLPVQQMQIDFEQGGRSFRIVFTNVSITEKETRPVINGAAFLLLER